MCLFHKWKYGEIISEEWISWLYGVEQYRFIRELQIKTCEKCGKKNKLYFKKTGGKYD
jgi:hypothetical protein